ncbi:dentin sialophosphoprotein-like [Hibiscus syriacus]|uniref:dentin sialophosphoprotein-like n=1 Tax=Hibiscus syriacus TaxID=106335 RepID=UPI001923D312|nr:dentin sialophosphoprotein-like [Hibiscus syriacus]
MGFDAKGIGLFVWKIIRFSGICSYKFVRKYPFLSGFFIFAFFVYTYFPSFFYILICFSPIIICTAIYIRFYWKTKHPKVQVVKKKDSEERSSAYVNRSNEEKPSPDVNRLKVPSLRNQKSVRRNARKEVLEWDRNDSPHVLFSRGIYDILPGKSSLLEENSKLALEVNGSSNMELGGSSSQNETRNDQAPNEANPLFDNATYSVSGDSFGGQSGNRLIDVGDGGRGGTGGVFDVGRLEERRKAENVKVQEDRNKMVEWTKEDEKNLMDLGSERHQRLESLMAKRRARKMFKMAIEKSLMDKGIVPHSQIAPILIVKNNILGASNNANEEGLQMPGSAPSVLLPTQNPFDLPYDPFEEKPNLTADSFLREFIPANQKEMFFCRHESFCHGPLFTFDTTPDPNDQFNPYYGAEKRLVGGPAVDRFRRSPDDEGGPLRQNSIAFGSEIDVIEIEESNHNEAMNSLGEKNEKITETANDKIEIVENNENPHVLSGSEVRMDIDSTKNNDSSSSASSSDDSESGLDQTTKPLSLCASQVRKALNLSIPPKGRTLSKLPFDPSPSPRRTEFNLFYNTYRRQSHTRNCSIASDLQVEVSEVGSTTLSTDGTGSPVEGDVTYDGDVERDINSDNEELWPGSFNLTREANGEKLRELDDIIEEDSVEVKLSGLDKKPDEPIASIFPSEQEATQILNDTTSLSSRLDTTEDGASYPANINLATHEDATPNVSENISPEDLGKTAQLTEKSVVRSSPEPCFQQPEQKPTEELNIVCNVKPITQGDANTLELKSSETRDDGAQAFIEPAALGEMRKPDEAINSDSCKYKHGNMETSHESTRTIDSQKKMEESQPLKYIEEDTHNLSKNDTADAPNAVQSRDQPSKNIGQDTQNLTEYNNGDAHNVVQSIVNQNIAEDNISGVEERLESSIAMDLTQRLAIEQTHLSSCALPRSVLPQNILVQRIPISNAEQQRQNGRPQSEMEDIERYNSASNQPQESSTFNMPPISRHLVENSMDHSSSNCNPGTSEGSSSTTKESPIGSPVHILNELVLEGTHGKEDSSTKSSKDESKTSTNSMDVKEPSKPSGESNPDFIELLGESKNLTVHNSGTDLSKSNEENAKSDGPKTMVTEKSAAEIDLICNVIESLTDKMTNSKSLNHVLDGEGDPKISSSQKAIRILSGNSGATSAGSVNDTEHESRTLAKADASAGLSTSNGESVSGAMESKEDNLKAIGESISGVDNTAKDMLVDHTASIEASEPEESKVKAFNTKENDRNEVAK